jgi:hypothetical protein
MSSTTIDLDTHDGVASRLNERLARPALGAGASSPWPCRRVSGRSPSSADARDRPRRHADPSRTIPARLPVRCRMDVPRDGLDDQLTPPGYVVAGSVYALYHAVAYHRSRWSVRVIGPAAHTSPRRCASVPFGACAGVARSAGRRPSSAWPASAGSSSSHGDLQSELALPAWLGPAPPAGSARRPVPLAVGFLAAVRLSFVAPTAITGERYIASGRGRWQAPARRDPVVARDATAPRRHRHDPRRRRNRPGPLAGEHDRHHHVRGLLYHQDIAEAARIGAPTSWASEDADNGEHSSTPRWSSS